MDNALYLLKIKNLIGLWAGLGMSGWYLSDTPHHWSKLILYIWLNVFQPVSAVAINKQWSFVYFEVSLAALPSLFFF